MRRAAVNSAIHSYHNEPLGQGPRCRAFGKKKQTYAGQENGFHLPVLHFPVLAPEADPFGER